MMSARKYKILPKAQASFSDDDAASAPFPYINSWAYPRKNEAFPFLETAHASADNAKIGNVRPEGPELQCR